MEEDQVNGIALGCIHKVHHTHQESYKCGTPLSTRGLPFLLMKSCSEWLGPAEQHGALDVSWIEVTTTARLLLKAQFSNCWNSIICAQNASFETYNFKLSGGSVPPDPTEGLWPVAHFKKNLPRLSFGSSYSPWLSRTLYVYAVYANCVISYYCVHEVRYGPALPRGCSQVTIVLAVLHHDTSSTWWMRKNGAHPSDTTLQLGGQASSTYIMLPARQCLYFLMTFHILCYTAQHSSMGPWNTVWEYMRVWHTGNA